MPSESAAPGDASAPPIAWASALASPRLTLGVFVLTALVALGIAHDRFPAAPALFVPLGLLAINLGAVILVSPRFRVDLPLLILHLALLALLALWGVARLIYFDGGVTVLRGNAVEGEIETIERGPLHGEDFRQLHLVNEGLHASGRPLGAPDNRVRWRDPNGRWREAEIGVDRPLELFGYRIYAEQRGLAPVMVWDVPGAAPRAGTLFFSQVARDGMVEGSDWQVPDGPRLWGTLNLKDASPEAVQAVRARLLTDASADALPHELVVYDAAGRRVALRKGQSAEFAGGRLHYLHLDTWVRYRIVRDPTLPWVLGALLVGVLSLVFFYVRRIPRIVVER